MEGKTLLPCNNNFCRLELAWGGSVAVAVGVGDMLQVHVLLLIKCLE